MKLSNLPLEAKTSLIYLLGSGAWIGISTQGSDDGLMVQAVAPDSPAMKAGLKDGEIIISLNNQKLAAPVEFSRHSCPCRR